MKNYHFELNRKDAVFWINSNGTISLKFIEGWIGCIKINPKTNHELLIRQLQLSKFEAGSITAERLNAM
ncbi:hypothetical protein ETN89_19770 (plasmid) [Photobacterium damselae subsp. damselae]|uniref:hypothetical protein n=1 Tax=Photobacterium damselae TaxID=38293 RepID=UPI0010101788|nr:hypothetical protein [Photobacterium damselae]QAY37507.1 hypothetical protein ETN89_19770 [Photobacterium damselae subsp. damselae]